MVNIGQKLNSHFLGVELNTVCVVRFQINENCMDCISTLFFWRNYKAYDMGNFKYSVNGIFQANDSNYGKLITFVPEIK